YDTANNSARDMVMVFVEDPPPDPAPITTTEPVPTPPPDPTPIITTELVSVSELPYYGENPGLLLKFAVILTLVQVIPILKFRRRRASLY
ncbi:MAG: hypothetical protein ACFFCW_31960, partial [Candidatus Hodarchaeota archaeon]